MRVTLLSLMYQRFVATIVGYVKVRDVTRTLHETWPGCTVIDYTLVPVVLGLASAA